MIYQISSGQGPAECELCVAKFLAYLQKHYKNTNTKTSGLKWKMSYCGIFSRSPKGSENKCKIYGYLPS